VAAEIARALDVPLDVIVARKLGAPFQPELAIGAVWPAGHLTVPACWSIWKSWTVNPPGVALDKGIGLIVCVWPAARRAARVAPDP